MGNGAFIVFSPGTPHGFSAREPLFHDWMHLRGDVTSLMNRFGLSPDTLYEPDASAGISEIVAFLEMEFFAQKPYWNELALARLQEMLIRISHCVNHVQPQLRVRDETAERLRWEGIPIVEKTLAEMRDIGVRLGLDPAAYGL